MYYDNCTACRAISYEKLPSVVAILVYQVLCYNFSLIFSNLSSSFYKGSVFSGYRSKVNLLMIFIELRTVGTLHCSRWYNMLPFCRELIKTVSRELNVGDNHQACVPLERDSPPSACKGDSNPL